MLSNFAFVKDYLLLKTKLISTMKRIITCATGLFMAASLMAATTDMEAGRWKITYDDQSRMLSMAKDGTTVLSNVMVRFKVNNAMLQSTAYTDVAFSDKMVDEPTGQARQYTITYRGTSNMPTVEQNFYLMDGKDYFLTDVVLSNGGGEVASNYICPLYSENNNLFLPQDANNRFLVVPFDNDGFVTYGSLPLSHGTNPQGQGSGRYARDSISFEVTAIFNGETQRGLILGSVEHDTWKSAVRLTGSPLLQGHISRLEVASGVTHAATRDHYSTGDDDPGFLQPHGTVKGTQVRSARMMVGYFDDWRDGMEAYGDVNAQIAPKRPYSGPTIYGWNSWGGMEKRCNYEGVLSVSDFIKKNLQDNGWAKDDVVYVGLDSWDNMNWDQRKAFAQRCHENGQKAGIYWTPWNDWSGSDDRTVEGNNGYTYAQTRVKVNGQIKRDRVDPTAPATLSRINYYIDKFKECGFEYIKLDFINQGCKEADAFYNPNITTGIQAYNYGMNYLRERCGDDIILDLSISPLFPAHYAEARRISCDAWGEMWHSSYMMNSLSFGWWLNRVYCYNDPDHLVMGDRSDGENMTRMTCAAVCGYCILGDNLSTEGSYIGTEVSQQKTIKYCGNERVNEVISLGKSFRPAYGHKLYGQNNSVDLFQLEVDDSYLIAHFNYSVGDQVVKLDLAKLGIDPASIDIDRSIECWTGQSPSIANGILTYNSLNSRPRLWRLYKK